MQEKGEKPMLTDDERKVLTEYIGECWHEVEREGDSHCRYCREHYHHVQNRTFATPADRDAVYSAMVAKEEWEKFYRYMYRNYCSQEGGKFFEFPPSYFTAWLFCLNCPEQIPERMKMATNFIKERKSR